MIGYVIKLNKNGIKIIMYINANTIKQNVG